MQKEWQDQRKRMNDKHLQQGLVVRFGNNNHIFMTQLLHSILFKKPATLTAFL